MEQNAKIYYLTKKGLEKVKKEYEVLKKVRQSKIKERSLEYYNPLNLEPEYFAFQDKLVFLESRINELEEIIKNAKLIGMPLKQKRDRVNLGATVLAEVDEQEDEFEIVGTLEANPSLGKISNECPVGKALLGHKRGDEVLVQSTVKTTYKIKEIKYKKQK